MRQSCNYAAVVIESPCSWILVYDSGDVGDIKSVQCRDVLCGYPQSRALSSACEDKRACSGDNSTWSEVWQYATEAQQYTEICDLERTARKNDHCARKNIDHLIQQKVQCSL